MYKMMAKNFPEEEELIFCTVEKIEGVTIFVRLNDFDMVGVIPVSEIAPGRIRNIRDYVTINKKIICKVMKVDREKEHIELSLRRVSAKDQRELLERHERERAASVILEIVVKEKKDEIINRIKKEYPLLSEFMQELLEKPELFERFGLEQYREKLLKIIKERIKTKKIKIRAKISLSTNASNGITLIKEIFDMNEPNIEITYLSAPLYSVSVESSSYKDANKKIAEILQRISDNAKKRNVKLEILK